MGVKLLAIGNVLMEDDGIAVFLANTLEESLRRLGIEVIPCETDLSFGISRINSGDLVFIMDAARQGKEVGEVSLYRMEDFYQIKCDMSWHDISTLDLIKLFHPGCYCFLLTIEVYKVDFCYGLSSLLTNMMPDIASRIINEIKSVLSENDIIKRNVV